MSQQSKVRKDFEWKIDVNGIVTQAGLNIFGALGGCGSPLIIGALTKSNSHTGWRNFYASSYVPLSPYSTLTCLSVDPNGIVGSNDTMPLNRL